MIIPSIPDPSQPAFLHRAPSVGLGVGQGRRWTLQHDRRSMILAAVRRQVADVGVERLTVGEVARTCGISAPTVYNLAGDRLTILNSASSEWVEMQLRSSQEDPCFPSAILSIIQTFWMSAIVHPEYVASAIKNTFLGHPSTGAAFRRTGEIAIAKILKKLRDDDLIRASISIESFTRQIIRMVYGGVLEWCEKPRNKNHFQIDLVNGPGMMLLGVLTGSELNKIEQSLAKIYASD